MTRTETKLRQAQQRLKQIARILEEHDHWLLAADGSVTQEPAYLREIYLLATGQRESGKGGQ